MIRPPMNSFHSLYRPITSSRSLRQPITSSRSLRWPITSSRSLREPIKSSRSWSQPITSSWSLRQPLRQPITSSRLLRQLITSSRPLRQPNSEGFRLYAAWASACLRGRWPLTLAPRSVPSVGWGSSTRPGPVRVHSTGGRHEKGKIFKDMVYLFIIFLVVDRSDVSGQPCVYTAAAGINNRGLFPSQVGSCSPERLF